jgi:hypothetical protein
MANDVPHAAGAMSQAAWPDERLDVMDPAERLGRALDHEIASMLQRLAVVRTGEGVVDHVQCSVPIGEIRQGWDIRDPEPRIGGRLDKHHSGAAGQHLAHGVDRPAPTVASHRRHAPTSRRIR